MWLIDVVIIVAAVWLLLFIRANAVIWIPSVAAILVVTNYLLPSDSIVMYSLLWAIFLVLVLFTLCKPLRINLLSKGFFGYFKRVLPAISDTEREALTAGDIWWETDLFRGKPDWQKLHSFSKPRLTQQEQAFLDEQVETLCAMLDDWQIVNDDRDLSPAAWQYMKEQGFLGMVIDKKYGGLGFSAIAHSTIIARIATRSPSAAVNVMVPNSLGPGELLMRYGTSEQKQYYLPRLASGDDIPCFGLTGTAAGSDAGAMTDYGIICQIEHEGQSTLGIRLNFDKRYITLAPIATVIGLACKLYDPDHLLGDKTALGISLLLLPAKHPGIDIGKRHLPFGLAFMNGPIHGKDVSIPIDWVIGGQKMIGQGWRMLMECLSIGRGISLPSLSAAGTAASYCSLGAYAYLREQFNVPIGAFDAVQKSMAQVAAKAYLNEACRVMTAGAIDLGVKPAVASAIAKYHSTENNRQAINHTVDVHAGRAVQLGPRNYLAHAYFALPVAITVEGANILTRSLIIFGQGAIRCHPHILSEMTAAMNNDLKAFDQHLLKHIAYTSSNIVRMLSFSFSAARFAKTPRTPLAYYYRQLTRMSTALAVVADMSMLSLGGQLKRRENLSARLGDVLSALYHASAVLKYHADKNSPEHDMLLVTWTLKKCLYDIQIAFDEFFDNFPKRTLARILRRLVFPYGRAYRLPSDQHDKKVAKQMMQSTQLRDDFRQLCYIGDKHQPLGRVEHAFQLKLQASQALKIIKKALAEQQISTTVDDAERVAQAVEKGLIDSQQANELLAYYEALADALAVDDFVQLSRNGVK